jgi:hypothetical protein
VNVDSNPRGARLDAFVAGMQSQLFGSQGPSDTHDVAMMKSIFLIYLRIGSDSCELDVFAEQFSSLLGGEVKTRLGRGAPINNISAKYWRSEYFLTSFEEISSDLIALLALIPNNVLKPFAGHISICLVERYQADDDRHGYYLSMDVLRAMASSGADFDLDLAEQGGFDAGKFRPVPKGERKASRG